MAPRVLLAGGGTAGHTSPLLATADALFAYFDRHGIAAVTTSSGAATAAASGRR